MEFRDAAIRRKKKKRKKKKKKNQKKKPPRTRDATHGSEDPIGQGGALRMLAIRFHSWPRTEVKRSEPILPLLTLFLIRPGFTAPRFKETCFSRPDRPKTARPENSAIVG